MSNAGEKSAWTSAAVGCGSHWVSQPGPQQWRMLVSNAYESSQWQMITEAPNAVALAGVWLGSH